MTGEEAIDHILGLLLAAWNTTAYTNRIKYDNVATQSLPPSGNTPWARATLRHTDSGQASLANAGGRRKFRRTGVLTVGVFVPQGTGFSKSTALATIVRDAYEGVSGPSGLWFRNVRINEIGPDGAWFLTNVVANFEYDDVK